MVKPISLKQVKSLRDLSGVGIMDAKKALVESGGDVTKAGLLLKKWGAEKLADRADRATNEGQVFAYTHHDGKLASLVKLTCETDFVARSREFQTLGKELALQVASMEAKTPLKLLKQAYVRDSSKTIADLVAEVAVRVKEKLVVAAIFRLAV
ncbi:elongation factor Ts [Patescibacteria group bacterium]|nr:elongation factor Ts [Patescibacteria group bacterium]